MIALITGASSGIGRDMTRYLNKLGYETIIVARDEKNLVKLKKELNDKPEIIVADLSKKDECINVYNTVKEKHEKIDLLINNAGFGLLGEFEVTSLDKELAMIDTNIKAVHILTKLFLKDMIKNDSGKILNVASIAGFMAGPLMATYYASKNYVVRLSQAIREELKAKKSNVKISILCPGPVDTNFNDTANVKFKLKGMDSKIVAKYAIDKTLKGKFYIIPGLGVRLTRIASKILSDSVTARFCMQIQEKKR